MNRNIFPLVKIEDKKWTRDEVIEELITNDPYIYASSNEIYNTYWKDKIFCDFNGYLHQVVGRKRKEGFVHDILRYFPLSPSSKVELKFKLTGEKISFEKLQEYLLNKIDVFIVDEEIRILKETIRNASAYEDLKTALGNYGFIW